MGWDRHHGMFVTTYDSQRAREAYHMAVTMFPVDQVIEPVRTLINGWLTMAVLPDGSKEGWPESNSGDKGRAAFKKWLREQCFDDGSSPFSWVEVQYGDDNLETIVVDDSDADRRGVPDAKVIG